MENLRDASCTDVYICRGDAQGEEFFPRLTFHGYRYVAITGCSQPPAAEEVAGVVLTSLPGHAGDFSCSDPLVNRLYQNILWSQRGNFISIPTDCPQRNERMGWMGDAQVFAQTALYNADVRTLYLRYLQAVRDLQADNGKFPDIAPLGGGFGGIVWGSAGVIIPWEIYRQYGDRRVLAENYPAVQRYLAYLEQGYADGLLAPGVGQLGDWLASDLSTDPDLIWSCYFAYDAKLAARMAGVLGDAAGEARYQALSARVSADWNRRFVSENGRTRGRDGRENDTQCSYAVPLFLGVADALHAPGLAARLNEKTAALGNTLTTGFVGTGMISAALSDWGYSETAYLLLQQTDYPSWLYSVTQGATTIWERWNSYTMKQGFGGNNGMNSFNHYSLGAVGAWLYRYVLGIREDEKEPGYHRFVLAPCICGFASAGGFYDSPYGRICSRWSRTGSTAVWEVSIPANTTALLQIGRAVSVRVEAVPKQQQPVQAEAISSLTLSSGRYRLQIRF